ncbi:T9SS type A sorting domain-containing protein [bacterium]|nr:T9SS type A sorting domain-containing protein [bacterium]
MKRFLIVLFSLILISGISWSVDRTSPLVPPGHVDKYPDLNKEYNIPANAPRWQPGITGELDILGDTIHVGSTWWEAQHNGTVGEMIGFTMDRDNPTTTVVWTDLEEQGGQRHVKFSRIFDMDGTLQIEAGAPYAVDAGQRAGYTTLAYYTDGDVLGELPVYHSTLNVNNPYGSWIGVEWSLFPGIFNEYEIPTFEGLEQIWPHAAATLYDDTLFVHNLSFENREDPVGLQHVTYSRNYYDPATETVVTQDQQLVTDVAMNIAGHVATSYDGRRVAVAQTVPWDLEEPELTQVGNDVWLWISEDGGETWDWNNPINLTDFLDPNPDLLPDTTAANTDTLRAYTDVDVYFDHDDILHVAFTTPVYYYYQPSYFFYSVVWHWDEESDAFTMVADGTFWNNSQPGSWQRTAQRPNMYQDPESGIMYLVYQQFGVPGDTLDDGTPKDASTNGLANGEVFITASPPNNVHGDWYGRLWTKGTNLTNTRNEQPEDPGFNENEREPSISAYNEGDYLNLFYIKDLDAGFTAQEEGEFTECPAVYHRVMKQDVLDSFSEWLPNRPMHVDETQHWEDPYGYVWGDDPNEAETFGFQRSANAVDERSELQPGEFNLEQNYPNPFNPSTRIDFSLQRAGAVQLTVYDLMGREIATLVDRVMAQGRHTVNFHGEDLASGVYFYKLSSGDVTHVQKMMLMK